MLAEQPGNVVGAFHISTHLLLTTTPRSKETGTERVLNFKSHSWLVYFHSTASITKQGCPKSHSENGELGPEPRPKLDHSKALNQPFPATSGPMSVILEIREFYIKILYF
jgi:hypothetical protein